MKKATNLLVMLVFTLALLFSCLNDKQSGLEAKISNKGQDICFMHDSVPWDYGGGYIDLNGSYIPQTPNSTEYWFGDGVNAFTFNNERSIGFEFNNNNRNNNIYIEIARAGMMYDSSQRKFRQIAVKVYPYTNNSSGCVALLNFNTPGKLQFSGKFSGGVKEWFGFDGTAKEYLAKNRGWGEPKWTCSTGEKFYPTNIALDIEFYWADSGGRASNVKVPNPKATIYLNDIDDAPNAGATSPEGVGLHVPNGSYSVCYQCTNTANNGLHDQYKGGGYSASSLTPVGKYKKDLTKITISDAGVRKTHWSTAWTSKSIGPANNRKTYNEIMYGRSNHASGHQDFGTVGYAFECYNSTGITILYKSNHAWGCSIDGDNAKINYSLQGTLPGGYTKEELTPPDTYVSKGTFIPSTFSTANYTDVPGYTFSGWRTGSSTGNLYAGTAATGGLEGLRSNLTLYGAYTKITVNAKGVKKWVGGNAGDTCTVQLMRSKNADLSYSEPVEGYTKEIAWSASDVEFSQGSLDWVDDSDHRYWYYWWMETAVSDGYKVEHSYPSYATDQDKVAPVTTITNTYVTVSPEVEKKWVDSEDTSNRPDTLSLDLMQKVGDATTWSKVKSVTISKDKNWKYTEKDMPAYRNGTATTYCFQEPNVPTGYDKTSETVDGNKSSITNILKLKTINISKVWDDENDFDALRPTTLSVDIKRGSTVVKTVTLSYATSWTQSCQVSMYHNKSVATYTVDEDDIEFYDEVRTGTFGSLVANSEGTGWDVTLKNKHKVVKVNYNVKKVWDDTGDLDRVRPESIKVQLYRDGTKYGSEVTLNSSNNWEHTWTGLCKWLDRKTVTFSVKEVTTPTYYTHVVKNAKTELATGDSKIDKYFDEVVNTHVPVCELTVSKKIPRGDVYDPFGVQSYIYKVTGTLLDGSVVEYYQMLTPRLNTSTGYYEASYTWRDLWSGEYVVKELPVDRFTNSSVTGSGNNMGTKDSMKFTLSCRNTTRGSVLYMGKIKNYKDYTHTDSTTGQLK